MTFTIDQSNRRVRRIRLGQSLGSPWFRVLFGTIAFGGLVCGGLLLYVSNAFGWLCFIPAIVLVMLHEWWRLDLRRTPPITGSTIPAEVLAPDVLMALKPLRPDTTFADFIDLLAKAPSYWFTGNRVLLLPQFLALAETHTDTWWPQAIALWQQYPNAEGVSASHISVALLLTAQNKADILTIMNTNEANVIATLQWFSYTQDLIATLATRRASGGIARDWAAGYTPLLDTYAQNISLAVQYGDAGHRTVASHQQIVSQLELIFSSNGRANCALVGDVGVGKGTCIQAFAESIAKKSAPAPVRYAQIYQVDAASMLAKISPHQFEYAIQRLCVEAHHAKNIILYFENAGAFFGMGSQADVTNILMPIIEGGRVRMIFSFTQNQWQYIQRTKSALAAALNYQAMSPTNEPETMSILENQALFTESAYKSLFTYAALKEVYRLADRYGPEIAMPGRAVSVLEESARNNQNKLIDSLDIQQTIEKTTGIKIATADQTEKQTLLSLEDQLHARVIGQRSAVREIVSALKRNRTGVGNPNKPIGTFLFLGPTGVGKTEVSKTLASAYFGGDSGMVRVDMNEYITQDSIHRLLSTDPTTGASFLDTIRKRPFSVVLFDEIEKAHPDIVNVLLQLLDEGVIRDVDNRVVSFKDAIIIATSNAGSDTIREELTHGTNIEQLETHLSDDLIKQGVFKPEFINRFDSVIIFSPLSQDELHQVVRVLLSDINAHLGNQGIAVTLTDDAVDWLATQGYDERLGARPLRRMMQKTVETAVSNILLERQLPAGSTITLTADQLAATL